MSAAPSEHPTWVHGVRPRIAALPHASTFLAWGKERSLQYLAAREEALRLEREDPLWNAWEPPTWTLWDCLLAVPWVDTALAQEVRLALGFQKPVRVLLINGANRGGKSEYAARTVARIAWKDGKKNVYAFQATEKDSRDRQQPLFLKYMPKAFRAAATSKGGFRSGSTGYIKFTMHNGFTDNLFVTPAASKVDFRNYSQQKENHEGIEADAIWCDELASAELIETLKGRITTRNGLLLLTFTPIYGYTPAVRMFYQSAVPVMESPAFLVPDDEGEPDLEAAMYVEDVIARIRGTERKDEFYMPPGRKFKSVPRVMRCHNDNEAIVFAHGADNPYGNPRQTFEQWKTAPQDTRLIRLYGLAQKMTTAAFPKFDRKIHVLPDAEIAKVTGNNVLLVDPAGARNFFMLWIRFSKAGAYVYREWPGSYDIPGVGNPGPWAENDAKVADGRRGPAQKAFGWGLAKYKEEIARLEKWPDLEKALKEPDPAKRLKVAEWTNDGSPESVRQRFVDSRAASSPRVENDRPRTLLTDFDDLRLFFDLTPGDPEDDGLKKINDALYFDDTKPIDFLNTPRLFVAESCQNTIYGLENYTGEGGERAACKEPIDLLRYALLLDLGYVPPERTVATPGVYF